MKILLDSRKLLPKIIIVIVNSNFYIWQVGCKDKMVS